MEPYFQPFEGRDYRIHPGFPGRLLVLGESAYLKPEDNHVNFTKDLLARVAQHGLAFGGKTQYFRKLFYVLTKKRSRDVQQSEWQSIWNAIAFYHFVRSARLKRARMRPNKDEWENSKAAFLRILSRLQPTFVLMTGKELNSWINQCAIPCEGGGMKLPIGSSEYAFARHICHPSSSRFKSSEGRAEFERLLAMK